MKSNRPVCTGLIIINVKVSLKARLWAHIFLKLSIWVPDTLKTNSVNYFDPATTLKIDPFPYMAIMPYVERLAAGDLNAHSEWC